MTLLISEMFWKTGKKLTIFYNKMENSPETWGWHWGRLQLLTDIWKCYIWRRMLTKKTFSTDDDYGPSTEEDFNWCLMMMLTDIWKVNIWRQMLTKKSFSTDDDYGPSTSLHMPLYRRGVVMELKDVSQHQSQNIARLANTVPVTMNVEIVVKCLKFAFAALTLTLNWTRCDETSLKVVPPPPWTIQPHQAVGKLAGLILIQFLKQSKWSRNRNGGGAASCPDGDCECASCIASMVLSYQCFVMSI